MSRDMTPKGYAFTKEQEGRALKAYRDSVGVWTIGYGITNYDEFAVQYLGKKIGAGMTITDAQAEYLLEQSMQRKYIPSVVKAMGETVNDAGLDGGASFHFNTGAISRASWVPKFRAQQDYKASLLSWNKAGGKVLTGLDRRRHREYAIIHDGDYGKLSVPLTIKTNASGTEVGGVAQPIPVNSPEHPLAGTPGMLRKGDSLPEVKDLQEHLLSPLGLIAATEVSGTFDDVTDKAVRQFQIAHPQLGHDGVVGPATRIALQRELDMKSKLTTGMAATVGPSTVSVVTDQIAGGALPLWAYGAMGAIVVATALFYAWKYRDEVRSWFGR